MRKCGKMWYNQAGQRWKFSRENTKKKIQSHTHNI